jgi:hypothetical protein
LSNAIVQRFDIDHTTVSRLKLHTIDANHVPSRLLGKVHPHFQHPRRILAPDATRPGKDLDRIPTLVLHFTLRGSLLGSLLVRDQPWTV